MPRFLANDHYRLVVQGFAAAPGNIGAGNQHAGVNAFVVLPPNFRVIVIDVFKDVAQADALGVAYNPHFVHRAELLVELVLHEGEQLLQRGYGGMSLPRIHVGHSGLEIVQPYLKHAHCFILFAVKNIFDVGQPLVQAVQSFFNIHHKLNAFALISGPAA